MCALGGGPTADVSRIGSVEEGLSQALAVASNEVARAECFDAEQRAEIYTILETLKANTETHRALVELLAGKMKTNQSDA